MTQLVTFWVNNHWVTYIFWLLLLKSYSNIVLQRCVCKEILVKTGVVFVHQSIIQSIYLTKGLKTIYIVINTWIKQLIKTHKLIKIKICQPTFKNRYIAAKTIVSSKEFQMPTTRLVKYVFLPSFYCELYTVSSHCTSNPVKLPAGYRWFLFNLNMFTQIKDPMLIRCWVNELRCCPFVTSILSKFMVYLLMLCTCLAATNALSMLTNAQHRNLSTQKRIGIGSLNLVNVLTTWPATYDHYARLKGHRSRSRGHVTYHCIKAANTIIWQRIVALSTSNVITDSDISEILRRLQFIYWLDQQNSAIFLFPVYLNCWPTHMFLPSPTVIISARFKVTDYSS